jgi:uncharacterized protein (DUF2252 family)
VNEAAEIAKGLKRWLKESKEQAKQDATHRAAAQEALEQYERTRASLAPWNDRPTPPPA